MTLGDPIINLIKKLLGRRRSKKIAVDGQYVISQAVHQISQADISPKAISVLEQLTRADHQAYLVGGGVRDLLLRKAPKDFDIATSATPNQVRRLFRQARIIGRRFKIVHVIFNREVIEVTTFRGHEHDSVDHKISEQGLVVRDNVFGTIEEDAWRRDFTINSLYYDIERNCIFDWTGGFKDLKEGLIRMIGEPAKRYAEDPVRMLRAVRFSAKLGFDIEEKTAAPIVGMSHLIGVVSNSRLFDEVLKLYHCGHAEKMHVLLVQYGLFEHLFKQTHQLLNASFPVNTLIQLALQNTDKRLQEDKPVTAAFLFSILLWFPVRHEADLLRASGIDPLPALDQAMSLVLSVQTKSTSIPKRFTMMMREIWLLQYRFQNRAGNRAERLAEHPRFRAAYDFLVIRALAGDESVALAEWWTQYQEVPEAERAQMIKALTEEPASKKRRRRKRTPRV